MDKVRKNKTAIILFMLPAVVLFAGIIIVPIFMSGYFSLFKWDGMTEGAFIGLGNYVELFTSKTSGFPKTVQNALLLAVLSVFVQLPISLGLALLLAKGVKGEKFFMAVFFVPVLISTVVIGQLWMKIYNPQYGIINTALHAMGLGAYARTWLGEQETALFAVFVPILWQYVGYHMLLLYAGIKAIPTELKEAARIDGATEGQISRFVLIPMLKPVIRICVIFAVTGSLKAFDLIYVLTGGGPAHASEVPSTLMVSMIFGRNRYGFGSSIAMFIIFLCFFFAISIKKMFKTEVE
ncbi:carbohydrate ABC transporter permease [Anaerotalea alkaliphila]|uniref:Sugar ABC transporter permease n=1 Tax=Anaerotalea alkaliphila TaxID=2662126 RepID=A0A7X5KN35_9FIRM|nr:sugar ABC transporter permease [Anaerotalea alkaliphila]NDL68581.1 sugar ABC transporter permease [Anaerotalea alkaliphila]